MEVLQYRRIGSSGPWRDVNNRDLQRDEHLHNLLSRGYAITYGGYQYRLFDRPRVYWIMESRGEGFSGGRVYYSLDDAIAARDRWWPHSEIIYVREVTE